MTGRMSALEARRQLSFLKSFDRKFQVLDREWQRLNRSKESRTTSKVGWPTDGLERTAKSLIGAGAVYGLGQISKWAGEFLDALGVIRDRKSAPSQQEMDWLADKIRLLEQMQRDAVQHAEDVVSGKKVAPVNSVIAEDSWASAPSESPKDSSKANLKDNSKDDSKASPRAAANMSVGSKAGSSPSVDATRQFITDSPAVPPPLKKVKPIFVGSENPGWKKIEDTSKNGTRLARTAAPASTDLFAKNAPHVLVAPKSEPREPSEEMLTFEDEEFEEEPVTMTVDLSDIVEIARIDLQDKEKANGSKEDIPSPPPVPLTRSQRDVRRILWPVAVGVLLLLLGVSLYFNLSGAEQKAALTKDVKSGETGLSSAADMAEPGDKTSAGKGDKSASEKDSTASSTAAGDDDDSDKANAVESAQKGKTRTDANEHESTPKATASKAGNKKAASTRQRRPNNREKVTAKRPVSKNVVENASEPPSPSDASGDGPSGRLRVSVPAGTTGDIRIFVDGAKKGKAPRILRLPPGLHEVRFEMDGKIQLKMVNIRQGETKDVTPRF
ncbi:MAG: hypothetical protein JXR76_04360 [Deltaproteobacteria bacterium]|nr:hypothetical protein [Deltaproteobacteria bacterium]